MPEELLNRPLLSDFLVYLWTYFSDLHRARGGNGFGANPIGYGEIKNWMDLTGHRLAPWEIRAILAADAAFLTVQGEIAANARKK